LFGSYDYWQKVFLNHAVKLYYVGRYHTKMTQDNTKEIELDVTFNRAVGSNNFMKINCIPVVNVEKEGVVVDERNPVKDLTTESGEFLNLLYDEDNPNDYDNILVRQFNVERYNSAQLFELMQEMLYRYNSDYYAFQNNRELRTSGIINNLQQVMEDIRSVLGKLDEKMYKDHFYAILTKNNPDIKKVDLKYLTTCGASANGIRRDEKAVKTSVSLNNSKTVLLLDTKGGRDSIKDESQKEDIAQYYHHTQDRLVTPADIIVFIKTFYFENVTLRDEIENISIKRKDDYVAITVHLKTDSYLKKGDKSDILAETLQNKITLRASGILPFQVKIL
jgi:hypothetical protein